MYVRCRRDTGALVPRDHSDLADLLESPHLSHAVVTRDEDAATELLDAVYFWPKSSRANEGAAPEHANGDDGEGHDHRDDVALTAGGAP